MNRGVFHFEYLIPVEFKNDSVFNVFFFLKHKLKCFVIDLSLLCQVLIGFRLTIIRTVYNFRNQELEDICLSEGNE